MSDDRWIVVPKWSKFQHYHDRDPVWIKFYTRLVYDDDYLGLTATARALLHGVWALYALSGGAVRTSTARSSLALDTRAKHWEELVHAGFIELSASRPLALRARSRERETETDKEIPKEKSASASSDEKIRRKATAWIEHNRGELADVDLAYVLGDQFDVAGDLLADLVAYAEERTR